MRRREWPAIGRRRLKALEQDHGIRGHQFVPGVQTKHDRSNNCER
jgi:hypothetical protein